jgi:hypothetical protein
VWNFWPFSWQQLLWCKRHSAKLTTIRVESSWFMERVFWHTINSQKDEVISCQTKVWQYLPDCVWYTTEKRSSLQLFWSCSIRNHWNISYLSGSVNSSRQLTCLALSIDYLQPPICNWFLTCQCLFCASRICCLTVTCNELF